jgi:plastocyanin
MVGPLLLLIALIGLLPPSQIRHAVARDEQGQRQVTIPQEDRFTPFAITIHVGQTVQWTNRDGDDHTVVSDNAFNTAGHQGVDHILPGTLKTGGKPSTFSLTFQHPGTFVYYCRFHAKLDADNQPIAPGPDGGIQAANGNFGTPMSGIVTVLPNDDGNNQH